MPWTVADPPPPAKNWSEEEKKKCVAAANAVLKETGDDAQAVYACIHAAGKSKQHKKVTAVELTEFAGLLKTMDLEKSGARHSKTDRAHIQAAHDHLAMLCDAMHCVGGEMSKANARHSNKDMANIKDAHDLVTSLGAMCPPENMPLGARIVPEPKEE